MSDDTRTGDRWTLWELPPIEPPRKVDTYARLDAVAMARQMNHEAQMRGMSTHYVAWPAGSHPPQLGMGNNRV